MKRILRTLVAKLSRSKSSDAPDNSKSSTRDEFDQESPKSVEMPDIYADEYAATVPDFGPVDLSSADADE